jgi:small-conductance mechanosensitive channel
MSSAAVFWNEHTVSILLRLLLILLAAILLNRACRRLAERLIRPASNQSRAEQAREQQTRTIANLAYSAANKLLWFIAILTGLQQLGISPVPALVVAGVVGISVGLGAQTTVRDVIGGCFIVQEDHFVMGETVQVGETVGRVEQMTLRRTVLRDLRGAQVSIPNGEMRSVANLSRDWSQVFVDVALAPEVSLDKPLAALERASAELRSDAAWSQALIDGPRVLGLESYDRSASVVRLQVKTLPLRQEEIARELRRRIQLAFHKDNIAPGSVLRVELANPPGDAPQTSPQSA